MWLAVAANLPRFEGDERAFRAWLASTARYQVIEATGRNGRRVGRILDDEATEPMGAACGTDALSAATSRPEGPSALSFPAAACLNTGMRSNPL